MISRSEYPSNIYIFYFLLMLFFIQSLIMALLGTTCSSLVTAYCYRINILVFDCAFRHLILGTSADELLKKILTILMQTTDFWAYLQRGTPNFEARVPVDYREGGVGFGVFKHHQHPPKFRRPSKILPNSTRL